MGCRNADPLNPEGGGIHDIIFHEPPLGVAVPGRTGFGKNNCDSVHLSSS